MTRLLTILTLLPVLAWSAPPERLSHQGRLTDGSGPVDREVEMTFRIFALEEGGTAVWTEAQDVEVDDGWYSVLLGGSTPGLGSLFIDQAALWLELSIDGGSPLLPRQRLASVPYALSADTAVNVRGGVVDAAEMQVDGNTVIDSTGAWVGAAGSLPWSAVGDAPGDTLGGMSCANGDRAVMTTAGWDCDGGVYWAELLGVPVDLLDGDDGQACTLTSLSPTTVELACGADAALLATRPVITSVSRNPAGLIAVDGDGNLYSGTSFLFGWPPAGPFASGESNGASGCGIRPDGTLGCWGLTAGAPLGTYSKVWVGGSQSVGVACAISATSGGLACWTSSTAPEYTWIAATPSGSFADVLVGWNSIWACGVRSTGTLACWTYTSGCTPGTPPAGAFSALLGTSSGHVCATRPGGSTECFHPCQNSSPPTLSPPTSVPSDAVLATFDGQDMVLWIAGGLPFGFDLTTGLPLALRPGSYLGVGSMGAAVTADGQVVNLVLGASPDLILGTP